MGMLVILPKEQANEALSICKENNHDAVIIGEIKKSTTDIKISLQ
jgi:phosphoribosylaminoimidazole (AIR) synthetase